MFKYQKLLPALWSLFRHRLIFLWRWSTKLMHPLLASERILAHGLGIHEVQEDRIASALVAGQGSGTQPQDLSRKEARTLLLTLKPLCTASR